MCWEIRNISFIYNFAIMWLEVVVLMVMVVMVVDTGNKRVHDDYDDDHDGTRIQRMKRIFTDRDPSRVRQSEQCILVFSWVRIKSVKIRFIRCIRVLSS